MDRVRVGESRPEDPTAVYTDLQGNPLRGYIAITAEGYPLGLVQAASANDAVSQFVRYASGPTVSLWTAEGARWRMSDGGEVPAYEPWASVEPSSFLGRLWAKISSRGTDLTQ